MVPLKTAWVSSELRAIVGRRSELRREGPLRFRPKKGYPNYHFKNLLLRRKSTKKLQKIMKIAKKTAYCE
jgi:hypothetical protein